MKTYRIGVIRVLTTDDPELLNRHGRLLERYFPMFETTSRCIPDQPEGIHDDETEARAVPKILALARQMSAEGFHALIISCAGDPAVEACRRELPIPVVGGGRSTAALAMFYGDRPAAVGITAQIPRGYAAVFGERCVGSARGKGVSSTMDLMRSGGRAATAEAARMLKQRGADVLALSCTGTSTAGIAPQLERELGIPVLDPVMSEGLIVLYELLRRQTAEG